MSNENQHPRDPQPARRSKTLYFGKRKIEHWQIIAVLLMIYDYIAVCLAYFLALWLRFDGLVSGIPQRYFQPYIHFVPWWAIASVVIFLFFRMYNSMWRFASFSEFVRTLFGSVLSSILHSILITVTVDQMPLSYYLIGAGLQFIFLIGIRFSFRFLQILKRRHEPVEAGTRRVMLIGAGSAAQMILRDMSRAVEISDKVVCIIDDNPNKWHRYMDGIPIVGGREEILSAVEKYKVDDIYLAIPSATVQQKRDILAICSETGCRLKQLPGMYQFVRGDISVSAMQA